MWISFEKAAEGVVQDESDNNLKAEYNIKWDKSVKIEAHGTPEKKGWMEKILAPTKAHTTAESKIEDPGDEDSLKVATFKSVVKRTDEVVNEDELTTIKLNAP